MVFQIKQRNAVFKQIKLILNKTILENISEIKFTGKETFSNYRTAAAEIVLVADRL